MGIDGIGKGGTPPIAPEGAAGVGSVGKTGATFEVETPAVKTDNLGAVDATSPLSRLRAGEIDVNGYVDLKVDEATKGLEGLPPTDLADLKTMLRTQMATDPGLIDLVQKATGHAPALPED